MTNFLEPYPTIDAQISLEPLFWLFLNMLNINLLALSSLQLWKFSDLENDYVNIYDAADDVNILVIPEYLIHAACCIIFLVTGHWFFFLFTLGPAIFNLRKFMKGEHRILCIELIRILKDEVKERLRKILFYSVLAVTLAVRMAICIYNSNN